MREALELIKKGISLIEEYANKGYKKLGELNRGDIVTIAGNEYIILKQDAAAEETHILSKKILIDNTQFGENKNFEESYIKQRLEEEILPGIIKAVGRDNIVEHTVNLRSVDMQSEFSNSTCLIRTLTFDEAREHNDLISDEERNGYIWTITPWSSSTRGWEYSMAVVAPSGYVSYVSYDYYDGVCPFCILKSNILVSEGGKIGE